MTINQLIIMYLDTYGLTAEKAFVINCLFLHLLKVLDDFKNAD